MKIPAILIIIFVILLSTKSLSAQMGEVVEADNQLLEKNFLKKVKKQIETNNSSMILSGQLIKKQYYKAFRPTGLFDLYLRSSAQDYYIKFCDSKIKPEELKSKVKSEFDSVTVEAEILNGNWDTCKTESKKQQLQRTGKYIVIYKIIN